MASATDEPGFLSNFARTIRKWPSSITFSLLVHGVLAFVFVVLGGLLAARYLPVVGTIVAVGLASFIVTVFLGRWFGGVGRAVARVASSVEDVQAIAALQSWVQPGWIPWSTYSISPAALLAVVNEVKLRRARTVVEFGSGVSTVLLGQAIQEVGEGVVVTFEDDEWWAQVVDEMVRRRGLEDFVTVVHRPLTSIEALGQTVSWYDIREGDVPQNIDVVLVDGPRASTGPFARLPALPFVAQYLSPNPVVFLDDTWRSDEAKIVDIWTREFGLAIDWPIRGRRCVRLTKTEAR